MIICARPLISIGNRLDFRHTVSAAHVFPRCLLLLLFLLPACRKESPRPVPAIEAYVWQSPDRPEVAEAIRTAHDTVSIVHVRAAELRWSGGSFDVRQTVKSVLP